MYKKTNKGDLPKRTRKSESLFEKTPEWRLMRADLDKGFKNSQAPTVELTEAQLEKYGISNPRTVARFIRRYIEQNSLGYEVQRTHRDGKEIVWVVQPEKTKSSRAA
jgi:hypothetical protein